VADDGDVADLRRLDCGHAGGSSFWATTFLDLIREQSYPRPMRAVLAAAVAAVLATGGARSTTPRIVGGTAAQRTVLAYVLEGMAPTGIAEIRLGRTSFVVPGSVGIRPAWNAWIVAGAYDDVGGRRGLPRLTSVRVGQAGWTRNGNPPPGRPPRATPASRAQAERAVEHILARSGATYSSIEVVAPDGVAVAVRVDANDVRSFMTKRLKPLVLALRRLGTRWDGLYVAVLDGQGRLAWANASRNRIGGGESFVRPELRPLDPFPTPTPGP
jgi:hypothetical protein